MKTRMPPQRRKRRYEASFLHRFHLGKAVDLARVAHACPLNFTGADFYALCSDALLNVIKGRVAQLEEALGTIWSLFSSLFFLLVFFFFPFFLSPVFLPP